jgi:hypothetical protein
MDLELGNILASEAAGPWKEQDETVVDERTIIRAEPPQRGKPILNGPGHRFDDESSPRSGNPDHRNTGRQAPT